jgi:hypothetical protein
MIKKIFNTQISFWFAFILMIAISGAIVIMIPRYSEVSYNISMKNEGGDISKLEYLSWPTIANAEFLKNAKDQFILQNADFIYADLSEMQLSVYKNGILNKTFRILSKGKEGLWWETPAGIYKIQTKEKSHFSSFGRVYMPWSMQFQGNFFIHGWPHDKNDVPVSSEYSGGCIRLSDEDSKSVYDLTDIGTPLIVFEKDFGGDGAAYKIKGPVVSAESYLVADLKNNFVFAESNKDKVLPIASLTKLVTVITAADYINLDKEITITKDMIIPTSLPRLQVGQTFPIFQLLYPLLLESSNEAALAIAKSNGEKQFLGFMNQKVKSLGMEGTELADSSGVDSKNISSVNDLFLFAKYIYNNRSFVLRISAGKLNSSAYGAPIFKDLRNFNVFSGNPEFVGGKVGKSTDAKETMLSIFEINVNGEKRPVAIIVLGSEDAGRDVQNILDYVKNTYERVL